MNTETPDEVIPPFHYWAAASHADRRRLHDKAAGNPPWRWREQIENCHPQGRDLFEYGAGEDEERLAILADLWRADHGGGVVRACRSALISAKLATNGINPYSVEDDADLRRVVAVDLANLRFARAAPIDLLRTLAARGGDGPLTVDELIFLSVDPQVDWGAVRINVMRVTDAPLRYPDPLICD